jgi:tetratricopeptide (TPR) repeat protein
MRLLRTALLVPWLALATATTATSAVAADPALEEAKTLTGKATIEYDVGHFDQALELYTRAYERYPKPALLFDIGQCHRLLGHYERAVFFFQGYLRGLPDATNRPLVEQLMADSHQKLDAQRAAAARPDATAPGPATPATGDVAPTQIPTTPASSSPGEPTQRPFPVLFVAGLATAGVGAVLMGAGVYAGLHSQSLANDVSQVSAQHGTWTAQDQSNYDSGKSSASAANVLYVTGAVALAAGGVLTWLGWPRSQAVTAAIAPSPAGASVALVARF